MKQTRLFKITTPEGVQFVTVHANTEAEAEKLITDFASNLGINPLAIYISLIETYHIGEE